MHANHAVPASIAGRKDLCEEYQTVYLLPYTVDEEPVRFAQVTLLTKYANPVLCVCYYVHVNWRLGRVLEHLAAAAVSAALVESGFDIFIDKVSPDDTLERLVATYSEIGHLINRMHLQLEKIAA